MFIIPLLAYIIGSVPSAYLIVRHFTGKNITAEGSGNVGAMNSYESTGKKHIGIFVFLADFLKGLLPILLLHILQAGDIEKAIAGVSLVLGHNFSIFLKFKGGKGLATAVGVFASINILPILLWGIVWTFTYKLVFKEINRANIAATLSLALVFLFPDSLIYFFNVSSVDPILVRFFILACAFLIMLKHIKDIKSFMQSSNN